MVETEDKKHFSRQITKRFLIARNQIVGPKSAGKVTAKDFGDVIGIEASNLHRIIKNPEKNFVTVEAIGRMIHHYGVSGEWLLSGKGEPDKVNNFEGRLLELEKTASELKPMIPKIKGLLKK